MEIWSDSVPTVVFLFRSPLSTLTIYLIIVPTVFYPFIVMYLRAITSDWFQHSNHSLHTPFLVAGMVAYSHTSVTKQPLSANHGPSTDMVRGTEHRES
ncbi:hypothetical protein DL89DRAFT_266276 [Linderina pennispora]|uniref:Uncharacterized protein n=1 Tax=Linderina pennispora TaxID=61395 RepID=A0A1Y1WD00_9FUNG|nr:uncharacterized protein DL89DRAFT_266276 [Linderina pennispora]ORX71255.1 hypothetical protein DL89DRAFT_266276 [Linderina pennispora]